MIGRIEQLWRRLRSAVSRSEWLTRLLRLQVSRGTGQRPGLVMIQIDGLSHHELSRALARSEMPFLARLIGREHYRLQRLYAGVPASTGAAQAELFYGIRQAVPGFSFRDRDSGELVRIIEPAVAARVERELDGQSSGPLLRGGAAYADNYTGGAEEPHFCPTARGWGMALRDASPAAVLTFVLSNAFSFVRVIVLMALEFVIAVVDLFRGLFAGRRFLNELKFVPMRVAITILLRELVVIGTKIDLTRGLPVIHSNFLGYDEQSHRRGPDSRFAHWTLKGIDDAIARLWKAAHRSRRRQYEFWVLSDHGQERVRPYGMKHGRSFADAVTAVFADHTGTAVTCRSAGAWGVQLHRSRQLGTRLMQRWFPDGQQEGNRDESGLALAALGPVAMIYWDHETDSAEREALARRLVADAHAPAVLYRDGDRVAGWMGDRRIRWPDDAAAVLGTRHPFLHEAAEDLRRLCHHRDAGDFIAVATGGGIETPMSFALENGAHGGAGESETAAFLLAPRDAAVSAAGTALRLGDLRSAALRVLGGASPTVHAREPESRAQARTLRVVTYNVHSCIGMDGRLSPERIARVIARCEADIVCLQELDMRRARTGGVDQAHRIAELLDMHFHFHPTLHIEEERYGDAVLSHLPLRTVHSGALPHWRDLAATEPRGAIWAEVRLGDTPVQVFNTHLGLRGRDRVRQVAALLGPEWLGHPDCRPPTVFCGDLNALPGSSVCRRLGRRLLDAQRILPGHRPRQTFSGRFPSARIDYVFVDTGVEVRSVEVPNNELSRLASDHLPLVVELRVADGGMKESRG